MALVGPPRIPIAELRNAILDGLNAGFTARAQTLATCRPFDPGGLTDADGKPLINTPALLLEIGPGELVEPPHRPLSGAVCYYGDKIEWRAYHIISSRPTDRDGDGLTERADPDLYTAEMTAITRAIVYAQGGQTWGHAQTVSQPEPGATSEPVDMKLPGHAARVLRWQQSALLVEDYNQ